MKERCLSFECGGETLLGILHEPRIHKETGVLVIVGGPQYRVGSHRQFVLMARALANVGYAVLRFDYRGMGDSTGCPRGFEAVDKSITLDYRVIGNWWDANKAADLANSMMDAGVDVILSIAGGAGQGTIKAAQARGRYVVYFDSNVYNLAPGTIMFLTACPHATFGCADGRDLEVLLATGHGRKPVHRLTRALGGPAVAFPAVNPERIAGFLRLLLDIACSSGPSSQELSNRMLPLLFSLLAEERRSIPALAPRPLLLFRQIRTFFASNFNVTSTVWKQRLAPLPTRPLRTIQLIWSSSWLGSFARFTRPLIGSPHRLHSA